MLCELACVDVMGHSVKSLAEVKVDIYCSLLIYSASDVIVESYLIGQA